MNDGILKQRAVLKRGQEGPCQSGPASRRDVFVNYQTRHMRVKHLARIKYLTVVKAGRLQRRVSVEEVLQDVIEVGLQVLEGKEAIVR